MGKANTVAYLRKAPRFECEFPALIVLPGYEVPAQVIQISTGGAKLLTCLPLSYLSLQDLRSVSIDGLGYFDADLRWSAANQLGVQFKNAHRASKIVNACLQKQGFI